MEKSVFRRMNREADFGVKWIWISTFLKKIIEMYNIKGKLNFIIGTDAFDKIDSWYKSDELKKLVHFIVFPRGVEIRQKAGFDYELAPMDYINISSTDVRKNHSDGTIKEVKEYIEENGLYRD